MSISRLKNVPLRKIWAHEAHSFTIWLTENLDILSEKLGFEISLIEREAAAGLFSADIWAEDNLGNYIVIENQLEKTDHDHLGKLITYMSNLEAKTAIWITSDPRPEHETAVHWLNETLPANMAFYLIKIEAYQIDNSAPAPLLTVVAGPSKESKQVGAQKKELAERHVLRIEFWQQLLEKAKKKTLLHANISPGKDNWITAGSGKSGLGFNYVVRMNSAQVELYIDRRNLDENKRIFDKFFAAKNDVELIFGEPLDWQRLNDRQASKIRHVISELGLLNRDRWSELQDKLIDAMVRLEKAFQPEIRKL